MAIGILGTLLLRGQALGLNVALVVGGFSLAAAHVLRLSENLRARSGALLITCTLFAGFFAWRSSPFLNALAAVGIVVPLGLLLADHPQVVPWRLTITQHTVRLFTLAANTIGGFLLLLSRELEWKSSGPVTRKILAILGGFALALPFVVIFGLLFRSADIHFQMWIDRLFKFDAAAIVSNVLWITVIAWVVAGWLRRLMIGTPPTLRESSQRFSVGEVELTTAVATLNVLFLTFVLVQVRYFFGGDSVVQLTPDLTYAEYARRGFFELVAAASLVLPLLLMADWLVPANARAKWFRAGCGSLILLLFVIMFSAVKRMQLYQAEYGLTELRFYVSAFMILLFSVFLWFAATVLRGERNLFATGAVVIGLVSIAALHVANPDEWIMRVNLERLREGKNFDPQYAAQQLSPDAFPALISALGKMSSKTRDEVVAGLPIKASGNNDWRSWNWGRRQAEEAARSSGFVREKRSE